ncbi:MAG: heme ABC transporter ATP-binding protein [Pseudomonadota bacterium]
MSLELKKASIFRNRRAILDDATFACMPGRFTALCGANGAGKTTALSVLSGALKPQTGHAYLEGAAIRAIPPQDLARRRAVVSQISMLTFPFEVHEVVSMGRGPHHGTPAAGKDEEIVAQVMALMDLYPLAEQRFTTLSGGERQRVHIARALAQVWESPSENQARWLLLDEPTSALDLKHQLLLMDLLKGLTVKGWGVVAVLHDLHLVKSYTDDVVLFKNGKIAVTGETAECLSPEQVQALFDLPAPYNIS